MGCHFLLQGITDQEAVSLHFYHGLPSPLLMLMLFISPHFRFLPGKTHFPRQNRSGSLFFKTIPRTQSLVLLNVLSEIAEKHGKQQTGSPMASQLLFHMHYPQPSKELSLGRKANFLCTNKNNILCTTYRGLGTVLRALHSFSLHPQIFHCQLPFAEKIIEA